MSNDPSVEGNHFSNVRVKEEVRNQDKILIKEEPKEEEEISNCNIHTSDKATQKNFDLECYVDDYMMRNGAKIILDIMHEKEAHQKLIELHNENAGLKQFALQLVEKLKFLELVLAGKSDTGSFNVDGGDDAKVALKTENTFTTEWIPGNSEKIDLNNHLNLCFRESGNTMSYPGESNTSNANSFLESSSSLNHKLSHLLKLKYQRKLRQREFRKIMENRKIQEQREYLHGRRVLYMYQNSCVDTPRYPLNHSMQNMPQVNSGDVVRNTQGVDQQLQRQEEFNPCYIPPQVQLQNMTTLPGRNYGFFQNSFQVNTNSNQVTLPTPPPSPLYPNQFPRPTASSQSYTHDYTVSNNGPYRFFLPDTNVSKRISNGLQHFNGLSSPNTTGNLAERYQPY